MTLLVTGGAGFIGRRTVRELVARDERVVALDVVGDRPADLPHDVEVVRVDMRRPDAVLQAVRNCGPLDAVVHLASTVGPRCEQEPGDTVAVNVAGAVDVIEAARIHDVPRIVYASSIGAYGPQELHGDVPISEEFPDRPVSLYGASKAFADYLWGHCADLYGLSVVGFRLSIVFGHGRTGGTTGWTSHIISDPAQGRPVRLPVRADQPVNAIYVDDVARLLAEACRIPTCRHRLYNSGGYELTAGQFAAAVEDALPEARISFDEQAPQMRYACRIDDSRVRAEFDSDLRPLSEAIAAQIDEARLAHAHSGDTVSG